MTVSERAPLTQDLTQAQKDSYDDSRSVSDGELVKNGGEHINGVLYVNPSQLEVLKQQDPREDLGKLVLHSPESAAISMELEEIIKATDNYTAMYDGIREAGRPVSILLDEHMPAPSDKDYTWRGQLKDEGVVEPWTTDREIDHFKPHYAFSGTYVPGEKVNLPKHIDMGVSGLGEAKPDEPAIAVGLDYDGYMLRGITVHTQPFSEKVFYKDLLAGNMLPGNLMKGFNKGVNIAISFDDRSITMSKQGADGGEPTVYEYRADKNVMQVQGKDGSMDSQTFLRMVYMYMALVPTMRETY